MSLNEVREVGTRKTDIMEVLERVADVTDMEGLVHEKFHRVFKVFLAPMFRRSKITKHSRSSGQLWM